MQVMVNNVLWTEVPSLFGSGPADQVYTTRMADDGTVTVGFGDGRSGARPPFRPRQRGQRIIGWAPDSRGEWRWFSEDSA